MTTKDLFGKAVPVSARNFEAMTRLPGPEGLREVRGELVPGMENVWYEYVPMSYDAGLEVPLVVQLHGGGNDGRRWADFTVWHLLAEQHGFLVVYPNSPDFERWLCDERDVQYVLDLIELMCKKYRVDRSRIYMQGMSNGDMMTLAFTMRHPEVLAAAGNITGPTPEEMAGEERPAGPLPLLQMRGEKDVNFRLPDPPPEDLYERRYSMNDFNRELWWEANGLAPVPALTIRGKDNFLKFKGERADLINWEVKDMGHREPADGAQVLWDCLYSGCRRVAGQVVQEEPNLPLDGDDDGVAIALGSASLLKKDELVPMHRSPVGAVRRIEPLPAAERFCKYDVGEMFESGALYAPVEFFRAAWGAEVELESPGDRAVVTFRDGTQAEFWSNSLLVKYQGVYRSLKKPCTLLCGVFFVPVGEFCGDILGKFVSENDGCMYICGHASQLGRYTARVLKEVLAE